MTLCHIWDVGRIQNILQVADGIWRKSLRFWRHWVWEASHIAQKKEICNTWSPQSNWNTGNRITTLVTALIASTTLDVHINSWMPANAVLEWIKQWKKRRWKYLGNPSGPPRSKKDIMTYQICFAVLRGLLCATCSASICHPPTNTSATMTLTTDCWKMSGEEIWSRAGVQKYMYNNSWAMR